MSAFEDIRKLVSDLEDIIARQAARIAELEADANAAPVAWLARDRDGSVWLCETRPHWIVGTGEWRSAYAKIDVCVAASIVSLAPGECRALHLGEKITGETAQPELQPVHRSETVTVFAVGDKVAVVRWVNGCAWRINDNPIPFPYETREEAENFARKLVGA